MRQALDKVLANTWCVHSVVVVEGLMLRLFANTRATLTTINVRLGAAGRNGRRRLGAGCTTRPSTKRQHRPDAEGTGREVLSGARELCRSISQEEPSHSVLAIPLRLR